MSKIPLTNTKKCSHLYNLRPRIPKSNGKITKPIQMKVYKSEPINHIMRKKINRDAHNSIYEIKQKKKLNHNVHKKIYELRNRIVNVNKNDNVSNLEQNTNTKKRKRDNDDVDVCNWDFQFNKRDDPNNRNRVAATHTKNALLRDHVLDLYKYMDSNKKPENNNFVLHNNNNNSNNDMNLMNTLFKKGNEFEKLIIDCLEKKCPNDIKTVMNSKITFQDGCKKTIEYMMQGVKIIVQAPLNNDSNDTYGIADIIIRSDFINELFDEEVIPQNMVNFKAPKLNGEYHYVVIDIKWSTIHLCANGKTIRNSGMIPAYKGQLAIYDAGIGQIQGYTPSSSYIMGKGWINDSVKNKSVGYNCFEKLGHIDYAGFDNKHIKLTYDAITWKKEVNVNGSNMEICDQSDSRTWPNLKNSHDYPYHKRKKIDAENNGDLTQIWNVGPKEREISHKKGIFSIKDKRCTSKNMGKKGKTGDTIDKILNINRSSKKLMEPSLLTNNDNNWQQETLLDFYVDFEYFSEDLYDDEIDISNSQKQNPFLCMIGVGYIIDGVWYYSSFTVGNKSSKEEQRIINDFANFINSHVNKYGPTKLPKIYHWSDAEKTIIATMNRRYNKSWLNKVIWCDMYKLFLDEQIVVKGAKNFKLKDIANAMKSHNMIGSKWDNNGINGGEDAMMSSINHFKSNNTSNSIDNVINYNEMDCKVMWEIVTYLRENKI